MTRRGPFKIILVGIFKNGSGRICPREIYKCIINIFGGSKTVISPPQDHDGLRFVFPLVPFFETSQSWVVILENIGNEYSGDFFVPGMRISFFWIFLVRVASG